MGVGVLGAFFSKSLSGGEEAIACLPPSVATCKSGRNPSSFKVCKKENVKKCNCLGSDLFISSNFQGVGLSSLIIFGKFGKKGHGRQDTKARFFFLLAFWGALFSPLPLPHSFPYPSSFHSPVERKGRKRVGKTELENGAGVLFFLLLPPLGECEKAKDGRSVSRQLQMLGMGVPLFSLALANFFTLKVEVLLLAFRGLSPFF